VGVDQGAEVEDLVGEQTVRGFAAMRHASLCVGRGRNGCPKKTPPPTPSRRMMTASRDASVPARSLLRDRSCETCTGPHRDGEQIQAAVPISLPSQKPFPVHPRTR